MMIVLVFTVQELDSIVIFISLIIFMMILSIMAIILSSYHL